jgi:DNA-binding SARP family transcriptional activator
MAYIEVDIDVDDFYGEMSSWDKQSMAEMLEKDGFCILNDEDEEDNWVIEDPNVFDEVWVEVVKKLFHGRLQLSNEDEETIKNIANKL